MGERLSVDIVFLYNTNHKALNFSKSNLKKLEELLRDAGYQLRYEKGNFNSGYCVLQDRRVVVVNKYYTAESRFYKIVEILELLDINPIKLQAESSRKTYQKVMEWIGKSSQLSLILDE